MSYVIFSDSGSDYSDLLAKEKNVKIIPLSFIVRGKEYNVNNEEVMKETYQAMRNKESVKTSCANVYTISQMLEEELKKGNDVLYLAFSSGLSATYQNGVEACEGLRKKYPDRKIIIIDTLSASLGQGLLLTYACEFRDQGESIEDVSNFIEANKLRMSHLFTVDEMFSLYNGGRISKSTYLIAQVAKIKPIMHMDDEGKLTAIGKAIGRKKSINTIINKVVETIEEPEKQIIYISHGDCLEEAKYIKDELNKRIKVKDIYIGYIGPVIGGHSGPGTLAVFYFSKHRI